MPSERTNDRVMEWMIDVERQSSGASADQKSQASKGVVKTTLGSNKSQASQP